MNSNKDGPMYGSLKIGRLIAGMFLDELDKVNPTLRKRELRVLDVFCGKGYFLAGLAEKVPKWQLYGFDRKERVVVDARREVPSAEVQVYDFSPSPLPYGNGAIDLVVSNMVMDYSSTRGKFGAGIFPVTFEFGTLAHEVSRVLSHGGYFSPFSDVPLTNVEKEIMRLNDFQNVSNRDFSLYWKPRQ